jgi:hypothetical protein
MNKRLTILELQEGKEYAAFDGDRRLRKTYRINGGVIENRDARGNVGEGLGEQPGGELASGEDEDNYMGCNWVPIKASVMFEEIGSFTPTALKTLFQLEENNTYRMDSFEYEGEVARVGGQLYPIIDGVLANALELDRLSVTATFEPLGVLDQVQAFQTPEVLKSMRVGR